MYDAQDTSLPCLEHVVIPDSTFELTGDIVHVDDLPKQCFATTYTPGSTEPIEYYTCRTCALNWLCENCIKCCHEGHETVVFARQHVPKWNCCYCVKSKACRLVGLTVQA